MQKIPRRTLPGTGGMTMTDLLATMAVFATVTGIAVPATKNLYENQRLGVAARLVERELQTARLDAVTANQPIRVRFNCPAAGQFRRVEVIGTTSTPAADDADVQAVARCSYPYPSADTNPLSRPNNDGPIQRLDPAVSFGTVTTLEFWPNGSVHVPAASNPWPQADTATGVTITVRKGTTTRTIRVNGLGKIQLQ